MRCHAICFHFGLQTDTDSSCTFMISDVKRKKIMTAAFLVWWRREACQSCTSLQMTGNPVRLHLLENLTAPPTGSIHAQVRRHTQFDSVTFFTILFNYQPSSRYRTANLVSYQQIKAGHVLLLNLLSQCVILYTALIPLSTGLILFLRAVISLWCGAGSSRIISPFSSLFYCSWREVLCLQDG